MTQESPLQNVSSWIKNSIMLKLFTIIILMLLLLIPSYMIRSIISERQSLNDQAIKEVSSKWAERQEVTGPILTIPILYEYLDAKGKPIQETKEWNILPKSLTISGKINPQKLRRGIYEIVVYDSKLNVEGEFKVPEMDSTHLKEIKFEKAFLTIGVSDLRGIKNQINVSWLDQKLGVQPGTKIANIIYSGVTVDLQNLKNSFSKAIKFKYSLDLQGSKNLSFTPTGGITKVNLTSQWNSPSFNGNFLPDSRDVDEDGFNAHWSILQLNRNFPQSWFGKLQLNSSSLPTYQMKNEGHSSVFHDSAFGVDLILPIDDYQKSMRSSKYAAMTIALTFLIFFLVEVLTKNKIHPFQYALVGLALCLFYTLLVSITEHSNFNLAYGVSTFGIVLMISCYSLSMLKMKRLTYLIAVMLVGIYVFLFVTLQLADYALLMGSAGLFIILGLAMYFTRNINWYKLNINLES